MLPHTCGLFRNVSQRGKKKKKKKKKNKISAQFISIRLNEFSSPRTLSIHKIKPAIDINPFLRCIKFTFTCYVRLKPIGG